MDKKHLRLHHFEHPSLAAKHLSQVWDMTFDKDGDLWLTTSFDLIRVNLKAGIAHSYPFSQIAQSTAQHHINHILCDKKGRIWLGSTGSGIYLFDKKTDSFVGYGAKQGLENGFITGLVESPLDVLSMWQPMVVSLNSTWQRLHSRTITDRVIFP